MKTWQHLSLKQPKLQNVQQYIKPNSTDKLLNLINKAHTLYYTLWNTFSVYTDFMIDSY